MNKRKIITLILYVAVLVVAFSVMLGLFADGKDNLSYSQIVGLFTKEQVKNFVVEENDIYLILHSEYEG